MSSKRSLTSYPYIYYNVPLYLILTVYLCIRMHRTSCAKTSPYMTFIQHMPYTIRYRDTLALVMTLLSATCTRFFSVQFEITLHRDCVSSYITISMFSRSFSNCASICVSISNDAIGACGHSGGVAAGLPFQAVHIRREHLMGNYHMHVINVTCALILLPGRSHQLPLINRHRLRLLPPHTSFLLFDLQQKCQSSPHQLPSFLGSNIPFYSLVRALEMSRALNAFL